MQLYEYSKKKKKLNQRDPIISVIETDLSIDFII